MLVLTIQDEKVASMMRGGRYKADFWKARFSCVSPKFTRGYEVLRKKLMLRGIWCDCPVFGWCGTPFIESIRDNREKKLVFLEVPDELLVFSDYDRFSDFVVGDSDRVDFLLSSEEAKRRISRGSCVQVTMGYVKPEWVIGVFEFEYSRNFEGTVGDFYRYCSLLNTYFEILMKKKVGE